MSTREGVQAPLSIGLKWRTFGQPPKTDFETF